MEHNIRQLSFGEVLDRSLRILVDNAVLLIGIAVFLGLPIIALGKGERAASIFFLVFLLIATPLVYAALTNAIADVYLNKPVTIASAYRAAWSIILPFVGTYLLLYLIGALVGGIAAGVSFFVARSVNASGTGFIALILFIAVPITFYLTIRWVLIVPIMIVERRFGLATLRRSPRSAHTSERASTVLVLGASPGHHSKWPGCFDRVRIQCDRDSRLLFRPPLPPRGLRSPSPCRADPL